jgi:hypothetical protein
MSSSWVLHRVSLVRTDVSEDVSPPSSGWQESAHIVVLRSVLRLLVTAVVVAWSPIPVTLKMEPIHSSESSVLTRATQHNVPEDDILQGNSNWCLHFWCKHKIIIIIIIIIMQSMELVSSWDASSCLATQEWLNLLWDPKLDKWSPLVPVPNQTTPNHTTLSYFSELHPNIPPHTYWIVLFFIYLHAEFNIEWPVTESGLIQLN